MVPIISIKPSASLFPMFLFIYKHFFIIPALEIIVCKHPNEGIDLFDTFIFLLKFI